MKKKIQRLSLNMGLINIDLDVYKGSENPFNGNVFKLFHNCRKKGKIKMKKYCEGCGKEVTNDEIIKGIEVNNNIVFFNDKELKNIDFEHNNCLIPISLIPLKNFNPYAVSDIYVLYPNENLEIQHKLYSLLFNSLKKNVLICDLYWRKNHLMVALFIDNDKVIKMGILKEIIKPEKVNITNDISKEEKELFEKFLTRYKNKPFVIESKKGQIIDEIVAKKLNNNKKVIKLEKKKETKQTNKLLEILRSAVK
ncbi:MAG TPA: hypothetical protein ENG63_01015 [Candidatus Desulfofervidus auxilii]|uniref:Ku domain-containing protein n=1 Tax=Desulfofervidus auxilii TaxID=1621989 RepID=A0A7C0Y836_DESA2|nr:hypothetical protein [Candidatus Desulfofervidus auxilii]